MARFGRKETFVASHYTHGFPQSPVYFHHVQPLSWGTFTAYGNPNLGYDFSLSRLTTRKWQSTLKAENANLAVYDLYDAVSTLSSDYSWKTNDIRSLKNYSAMSTLAANNSSAYLKTAYWLKLVGLIAVDKELQTAASNNAEQGYKLGEQAGASNQSSNITTVYRQAYDLAVSRIAAIKRPVSDNMQRAFDELKKGMSSADVAARVKQAKKEQQVADDAAEKADEPPKARCEDTWMGKIPGYCSAAAGGEAIGTALKWGGYAAAAGIALWGASKLIKGVRSVRAASASNPRHHLRTNGKRKLLSNPSAPGEMSTEPERKIARMTKGRLQEKQLANTVFRMENS